MVSGAVWYSKAPVGWPPPPGACLEPPGDCRLTWLLLSVVAEIHRCGHILFLQRLVCTILMTKNTLKSIPIQNVLLPPILSV